MGASVGIQRWLRRIAVATTGTLVSLVACAGVTQAATIATFSIPTADSGPTSLVAGPGNDLYFGEQNAYKVGRVDMNGNIAEFPVPNLASGISDAGPAHLTSSGGYIWLLTDVGETGYRMDTAGNLDQFTWDGSFGVGLGPADNGGVWLFDNDATGHSGNPIELQQIGPGGALTTFQTDEINQSFAPMALAPDGSEWYSEDAGNSDYLNNITDAGSQNKLPIPITDNDLTYDVTNIAFSSDGTLWFTEHAPYDSLFPVGGAVGMLAPGSNAPQIVWSVPSNQDVGPASLTAGPGGVMYFSYIGGEGSANGIGEITADGRVTLESTSPYKPQSVVYGPDGNLWFVDTTANVVGRVSPSDLFSGGPSGGGGAGGGGGGGGTPTTPTTSTPTPTTPTTTTPTTTTPTTAPTTKARTAKAPVATVGVPHQRLSQVRRSGRLTLTCTLAGAGTCAVQAEVAVKVAKRLKLKVPRKAKMVSLAKASTTLKKKGRATLTLKLSKHVEKALRHTGSLKLSVAVTSTAKHDASRHATKTVKLSG